jgi:hypothetical protein
MCRIIDYMAKIGLWETVQDFELLAQKNYMVMGFW